MKKYLILISFFLLLLTGCATTAIPEWRSASFDSLERYKSEFLSGKDRPAAVHFQKTLDEIRSSGDLTLLMTAYLTRSALRIAVLETPDYRDYLEIVKADPADADEQRNYYWLLEGNFAQLQKGKLPASYQDLAAALEKGEKRDISRVVGNIQDDLSRLIATGLAVRHGMEDEALLIGAVDLASLHGWRKPLLVYLERLKSYYRKDQNADKEEKIRLKLELLTPLSGMGGKASPAC